MSELVTKADLAQLEAKLMSTLATKTELRELKDELMSTLATKAELGELKDELKGEMSELRQEFRHQGVLFEQLGTKVQVIAEGLVGLREQVSEEIRALRKELTSRIDLLEEVVKKTSGDLQDVKADVADLRLRFNRLERESDLEKRVAEVEKRLGIR